jgi:hypothetical protein
MNFYVKYRLSLIQCQLYYDFTLSKIVYTLSIRFYALAAAAALLKYIEFVRNVLFAPKSLKVEYQGSQNTMVIGM